MYDSFLTHPRAREDFYKSVLLRLKRRAGEAKKTKEKEIENGMSKILSKKVRLVSIKKRWENFSALLENSFKKKIPKENLAARVPQLEKFSFDGAEAGEAALDTEAMPDYIEEGEEGEAQVNLKKVRKEAIERFKKAQEAKKRAQQAKKAAEAAKVAKTAKSAKGILNIAKIATVGASLETLGISLLITYLIWLFQFFAAHMLKNKYIPKLATWEMICFIFLTLIIVFNLIMPFMIFLIPIIIVVKLT